VGQTVAAGGTATFTAAATGSPILSYQWYRVPGGGTNPEIAGSTSAAAVLVTGATSASYTVPAADIPPPRMTRTNTTLRRPIAMGRPYPRAPLSPWAMGYSFRSRANPRPSTSIPGARPAST
jgi:hypothetical protein